MDAQRERERSVEEMKKCQRGSQKTTQGDSPRQHPQYLAPSSSHSDAPAHKEFGKQPGIYFEDNREIRSFNGKSKL